MYVIMDSSNMLCKTKTYLKKTKTQHNMQILFVILNLFSNHEFFVLYVLVIKLSISHSLIDSTLTLANERQ